MQRLTAAASSTKSSYSSRIHYSYEGEGSPSGLALEALFACWLSWFVFPSGLEVGLNDYVFPLAIILEKRKKLELAPSYPGSLYARFDNWVANMTW